MSSSKKPKDNTVLFASCAKDWTFSDCEPLLDNSAPVSFVEDNSIKNTSHENTPPKSDFIEESPLDNQQTSADVSEKADEKNKKSDDKTNSGMAFREKSCSRLGGALNSPLQNALSQTPPLSPEKSAVRARELLHFPKDASSWHLYLMKRDEEVSLRDVLNSEGKPLGFFDKKPQEVKNKKEVSLAVSDVFKASDFSFLEEKSDSFAEDPLAWLQKGMEMGWLRYLNSDEFSKQQHHAYLSQEAFWEQFSYSCEHRSRRLSLVLFRLPEMCQKEKSDYLTPMDSSRLQELIEQVLLATYDKVQGLSNIMHEQASYDQSFFGEIQGFGLALVLLGHGVFSATACAERIMSRLDNSSFFPKDFGAIRVGVAEMQEGENADTVFANAKSVILSSLRGSTVESASKKEIFTSDSNDENSLRVNVHHNTKKASEKTSLVQSDEKRFLFFGME